MLGMPGITHSEPDVYDLIPKVELHCHVEGAIRPSTMVEFARNAKRELPFEALSELQRYGSIHDFRRVFALVLDTLTTADHWVRIGYESLIDGTQHGLRYRELYFTPSRYMDDGQDLGMIIDALSEGIAVAEEETGARCQLIASCDRTLDPASGISLVEELVELRRAGRAERVIGIGIDGPHSGFDLRSWGDAYEIAHKAGLRRTAHSQDGGPANVAIVLDHFGAERIDHAMDILDDPLLTNRVAEARIPINVCPNSNVRIFNVYPSLEEHPFRRMREAGLLVTLNTDDPTMMDVNLGEEYRSVAKAMQFDFDAMAAISLDGIEASWLDESEKRSLRAIFQKDLDALRH